MTLESPKKSTTTENAGAGFGGAATPWRLQSTTDNLKPFQTTY